MDLLDRLHERLLVALASNTRPPGSLITVGEVYQRLIPYRGVRNELGILELAEYEHALLRLIGGEGGLAEIEDLTARAEIVRELASVNPILGIYRDYPEVRIRILLDRPRGSVSKTPILSGGAESGSRAGSPPAGEEGSRTLNGTYGAAIQSESTTPQQGSTVPFESSSTPVHSEPTAAKPSPSTLSPPSPGSPWGSTSTESVLQAPSRQSGLGAAEDTPSIPDSWRQEYPAVGSGPPVPEALCRRCQRVLPTVPDLRFCPYCGVSQGPKPCPRCGTPREGGWSFCIRCGAGVGNDSVSTAGP
jgi:hypothetical protein